MNLQSFSFNENLVKKLSHAEFHHDAELELAIQVQGDSDCMEIETDITSSLFYKEGFYAELHC